jgi:hypothetical protein
MEMELFYSRNHNAESPQAHLSMPLNQIDEDDGL